MIKILIQILHLILGWENNKNRSKINYQFIESKIFHFKKFIKNNILKLKLNKYFLYKLNLNFYFYIPNASIPLFISKSTPKVP